MPYKICTNCQEPNGVRTLNCKKCNHNFITKSKTEKPVVIKDNTVIKRKRRGSNNKKILVHNLNEIHQGDIIKVLQGTGPYYLNPNGERKYISEPGIVVVEKINGDGFWGHHYKLKKNRGSFFFYMGERKVSPLFNTLYRDKHKIIKYLSPNLIRS